jgi:hypothetical protein
MSLPGGLNPLSIEISSKQVTPIISVDNSIYIKHGDYSKDEIISELPGDRMITQEKIDDVFNEIAHHCLARVHTCCQENHLFVFYTRRVHVVKCGFTDGEVVTIVTRFGQTHRFTIEPASQHWIIF